MGMGKNVCQIPCCKQTKFSAIDFKFFTQCHWVKGVRIRIFSCPYSVRMREKTDHKNAKYGHFSQSDYPPLSEEQQRKTE